MYIRTLVVASGTTAEETESDGACQYYLSTSPSVLIVFAGSVSLVNFLTCVTDEL